jgi:hypothetical protein
MVLRHELCAVWPPFGAENSHLDDRSVAWRPNPTRRRRPRVGPAQNRAAGRVRRGAAAASSRRCPRGLVFRCV